MTAPGRQRRGRAARGFAIGLAAALLCCAVGVARADSDPISPAETLLFMTSHLKQLPTPNRLHYAFLKSGTLEKGFADTIDIDVTGAADGSKKGVARFFSGTRKIEYPEVEHAEGNPVLLFYLEREIHEMARLTGGQANYFRKRIRLALAQTARIKPIDISFGGQTIGAQQITISPYADDPNRSKFERLAAKQYVFTLSDKIPGSVYQVRGLVPPAGEAAKDPVIDETLTLQSAGLPN